MLRIYPVTIDVARAAGTAAKLIAQFDTDLARQLRRAASSVVLNTAEGTGLSGGYRRQRYGTALGSAREVVACFDVAVALGFVSEPDRALREMLNQVVGTLVRLTR